MVADFTASEVHLVDHLLPVWMALDPFERGRFHLYGHRVEHLLADVPGSSPLLPDKASRLPLVGAQWGDVNPYRRRRPVVLLEHGIGATYPEPNPAFAGGTDRDGVVLYLCPNEHVRQANVDRYPHVPAVVVGTPLLDVHPWGERTGRTVVLTTHWDMTRFAASRSALPHHADGLRAAADELRADGWAVWGTAHPRAWVKPPHARQVYDRAGIDMVTDFGWVLDHADVLVCDVSSAAWLSAAVGVAQVVLDAPVYRVCYEAADVWPRFTEGLPLGFHAGEPRLIPEQIRLAAETWAGRADFQRSVRTVVPHVGGSARRAVDAIREHVL